MGEDGVGEDLHGEMIHDWFGNCKVGWVGGFFANSGSFGVHRIHHGEVWLVGGGGNAGIMDEFIDRVRGWEEA